jgi:hypothetical protein
MESPLLRKRNKPLSFSRAKLALIVPSGHAAGSDQETFVPFS